jgi:L-lactate dehydrogenase (cytochrome)
MTTSRLHRLAAFTTNPTGGNPAGVWIGAELPPPARMQEIASEVGYSETAFLAPTGVPGEWTVRYYSPEAEVDFCGHATIASAVALGQEAGDDVLLLQTVVGEVPVEVSSRHGLATATLTSVEPARRDLPDGLLDASLAAFGWTAAVLDPNLPPDLAFAGAWHLVLPLADRGTLAAMEYDFDALKTLMLDAGLTTVQVVWRDGDTTFHARDPFPVGGVVEDPATGAAAAALGGYLRLHGLVDPPVDVTIHQGVDMGRPSLIEVHVPVTGGIRVRGAAVPIGGVSVRLPSPAVRLLDTLRSVVRFEPVETDPVARRLARVANVSDARRVARRRLPRGVFDYIDGGAEDERALAANTDAFARTVLRPRVLCDVSTIDTTTTLLGRTLPIPLALSPTGFTRIVTPGGELDVARAAARAGLPYTLSTLGTRSIEEVRAVSDGALWFQVYVWRDRELVADMVERASASGYEALMVTVDTAVLGRRERDVRRGFTLPPKIGPGTLVDGALHPAWTWAFVRSDPIRFANVAGSDVGDGTTAVSLADYVNSQFDPTLSWRDLEWLRERWDGPIVVKGVQSIDDAVLAADTGVDAIALSNHGGRQLDAGPATYDLVAPVSDAVGDRVEIICDGGVRRGSDVVKAVAAGARACTIGRAYLYGLAAGGERGVDHVLSLLRGDIERTMALIGVSSVGELGPHHLGHR